MVGPHSPIIEYIVNGEIIWEHSFIDPWCSYERENFTTLVPSFLFTKINDSVTIRLSKKIPNYSIVPKLITPYSGIKKLNIKSIHTCNLSNLGISF
jgi:hypothetical protein